jgi:hypothetical protein
MNKKSAFTAKAKLFAKMDSIMVFNDINAVFANVVLLEEIA